MSDKKDLKLHIGFGSELFIQTEGSEERYKSVLTGLAPPDYLIVRPQSRLLYDIQYTNLIVRYVFMGNIYGFQAVPTGFITSPYRLLFLSYPDFVESLNLRKAERVDCNIPAISIIQEIEINGLVTDISSGGVRFTIITESLKLPEIKIDDRIKISFRLFGQDEVLAFLGRIKSINGNIKRLSFGIQFYTPDELLIGKIDNYINEVLIYQNI